MLQGIFNMIITTSSDDNDDDEITETGFELDLNPITAISIIPE